jgi:hypothetical protein
MPPPHCSPSTNPSCFHSSLSSLPLSSLIYPSSLSLLSFLPSFLPSQKFIHTYSKPALGQVLCAGITFLPTAPQGIPSALTLYRSPVFPWPLLVTSLVQSATGTLLCTFAVTEPWAQDTLGRRNEGVSKVPVLVIHLLSNLSCWKPSLSSFSTVSFS